MKATSWFWSIVMCSGLTATTLAASSTDTSARKTPGLDLSRDKVLYVMGYAHLDTQWNWTYPQTINTNIKNTLYDNFDNFAKFPAYTFNFTGSVRYRMMKEYYPAEYERVKDFIRLNRWFIAGSSVDENDVNMPSSESIIRQILYGNQYFKKEFGKESVDILLPDCFGFPASMPSIWAHAGMMGFSTQKLTWGSAVGIPFNVGVWEGPDGKSVVAALNPGEYVGRVNAPLNTDSTWVNRVNDSGEKYGVFTDYHYYGVGDQGGAPRPEDVANVVKSLNNDGSIKVIAGSSDQMYIDLTTKQKEQLPHYKGDLLLTQHSAGSLTSKAFMKRWNRKNELLADATEKAAVTAQWLGGASYPQAKLGSAWERVLASQMHDILPGTAVPKAYEYSNNDEIIALNQFSSLLENSVGAVSRALDTNTAGQPLVVYNPLSIARNDVVEAALYFAGGAPAALHVEDSAGVTVPSQIVTREGNRVKFLFNASVPAVGYAVYAVTPLDKEESSPSSLAITANSIESDKYRVTINSAGDVASIVDKTVGKELLAAPARLEFLYEQPEEYPAWNMSWNDRQKPPYAYVDGPATIRIVEHGPVRVALEITRSAQGSRFTQRIRLNTMNDTLEFATAIDWLSRNSSLKASFPLTVANPVATYNMDLGTIERANNEPAKYEVPSHKWFDLTGSDGAYGVSVLEDSKFGSDKPADNILRLTLLYTPNTDRGGFNYQATQDWGHHDILYALYGHTGDHRAALSEWQAARLNQPLTAYAAPRHGGTLGRNFSMTSISTPQVALRALKKAEEGDYFIIRLQELWGKPAPHTSIRFAGKIIDAYEVDGQERRLNDAIVDNDAITVDIGKFSPRSFAVKLAPAGAALKNPTSVALALPFNADVISTDNKRDDGGYISANNGSYPAEQLPAVIESEGIRFNIGPTADGAGNAVQTSGQVIDIPSGYNQLYLLAAASDDTTGTFLVDDNPVTFPISAWSGFVGMSDQNIWGNNWSVKGIQSGFIKRDNIAWFATHRHFNNQNDAYTFSYLFKYRIPLPAGAKQITLPQNNKIRILAMSAAYDLNASTQAASQLYDNFDGRSILQPNESPTNEPAYDFGEPTGKASVERVDNFNNFSFGPPSSADLADKSRGTGITVNNVGRNPHNQSGMIGTELPRLNDGDYAQNNDDTSRSVWYDQVEGRFVMDLKKSTLITRVNTYSYHKSNRAPQKFILIGSNLPNPNFATPTKSEWQLLASVDTWQQGEGGIHGSSVASPNGSNLGTYRYLMWISANVGEGTFYTELDVY